MTEKESTEKTQIEATIENDKILISDEEGISEFYKNSYIGTLDKDKQ